MKEILLITILLILAVNILAYNKEIPSNGVYEINASTVIGLYTSDNKIYTEGINFYIEDLNLIEAPVLKIFVHVGADIKPIKDHENPQLWAMLNNNKIFFNIKDAKKNSWEWLEVPVPKAYLKNGENTVALYSNISNTGNITNESIDISASKKGIIKNKSYAQISSARPYICRDRNWNIKLSFNYLGSPTDKRNITAIEIIPKRAEIGIDDSIEYKLEATINSNVKKIIEDDIEWSVNNNGIIYADGTFSSQNMGKYKITAKLGDLSVNTEANVKLKVPSFVEPPKSKKRFVNTYPKNHSDLKGEWQFVKDTENIGEKEAWYRDDKIKNWNKIYVPGAWQAQGFGADYHGVGWYRKEIDIPENMTNKRLWINFEGIATYAKVYLNSHLVGEHRDNWSAFQFDISKFIKPNEKNILIIRVAEEPNFASAGFPLIVAQHYGGIWQGVSLYTTKEASIEDVWIFPNLGTNPNIEIETQIDSTDSCEIKYTVIDPSGQKITDLTTKKSKEIISIPNPQLWNTDTPALYTLITEIYDKSGQLSDEKIQKFGMREVKVENTEILINGKPIYIRGMLNWGYYPQLMSNCPSEATIREEFSKLKAAGFNLMKICLFVMPKRYYEIADEMGMLIWQEYPTWQSFPQKDSIGPFDELYNLYLEWVKTDRNHPSVIIRDLTCESHNTNPEFAAKVFDKVKAMTKSPLLEDNSSYLNNIKTDFWDWHIYTELSSQYDLLKNNLIPHIKNDPKPYMSGEDIDCDTYRDTDAILSKYSNTDNMAWWINTPTFNNQLTFEEEITKIYGKDIPNILIKRQLERSKLVKKMTIESMRIYDELNGYVLCSLYDNMLTSPGFYDDTQKSKWSGDAWKAYNNEDILVAVPSRWSFSYKSGETAAIDIKLSNFGDDIINGNAQWSLKYKDKILAGGKKTINSEAGKLYDTFKIEYTVPNLEKPIVCQLTADLDNDKKTISNSWDIYLFPEVKTLDGYFYGEDANLSKLFAQKYDGTQKDKIIVTNVIDDKINAALKDGEKVIYIAPDGDETFPRSDSAFWREMNHYLPIGHKILGDFPVVNDIAGMQFIPLTQNRPFNLNSEDITPLAWGISCRFNSTDRLTYLFEKKTKNGLLIGCSYRLNGENNIPGIYMLKEIIEYAKTK